MTEPEKDIIVRSTKLYAETDGGDVVAPDVAEEGSLTHDDDGSFPLNALGKLVRKTRRREEMTTETPKHASGADKSIEVIGDITLGEAAQAAVDAFNANPDKNESRILLMQALVNGQYNGTISPEESRFILDNLRDEGTVVISRPEDSDGKPEFRDGKSAGANDSR